MALKTALILLVVVEHRTFQHGEDVAASQKRSQNQNILSRAKLLLSDGTATC